MVFATLEPEVAALYAALTALVVILTTVVQTWFMGWRADQRERRAKQLAAARSAANQAALDEAAAKVVRETKAAAEKVAQVAATAVVETQGKVDKVYDAVNGNGLGGKMDAFAKALTDHTKDDSAKFGELKSDVAEVKDVVRLTAEQVKEIMKRIDEKKAAETAVD